MDIWLWVFLVLAAFGALAIPALMRSDRLMPCCAPPPPPVKVRGATVKIEAE